MGRGGESGDRERRTGGEKGRKDRKEKVIERWEGERETGENMERGREEESGEN